MIKFTNFFKKRFKEFKSSPQKIEVLLTRYAKRQGKVIVNNFKEGILNDSLGLKRLTPKTIKKKSNQGFDNPDKPLVGKGKSRKNSYANMMKITSIKNGVKISPRNGMHWSKTVSLKKLFVYHEYSKRILPPKRPAMEIVLKNYKKAIPKIKIDGKTFDVELKER